MGKRSKGDQVSMEFRVIHTSSYTNGAGMAVTIPPSSLSESFTQVNDLFRYFRMDKLVVKSWVFTTGTTDPFYCLFWVPVGITNAISAVNQIDTLHCAPALAYSNTANGGMPGTVATLSLPKAAMQPPGGEWYVTQSDASDGMFDFAGTMTIQMDDITLDGTFMFDISFTCTFKERLDPVMISMALEDKVETEVRKRMALLCVKDSANTSQGVGGAKKVVTKPKSYFQAGSSASPSSDL